MWEAQWLFSVRVYAAWLTDEVVPQATHATYQPAVEPWHAYDTRTRSAALFTAHNMITRLGTCRSGAVWAGGQGWGRTADLPILSRLIVHAGMCR